jgi:hypothetical protein
MRARLIFLAMLLALCASAAHVRVSTVDSLSVVLSNMQVSLSFQGHPSVSSTNLIFPRLHLATTDVSGNCVFSNAVAGRWQLTMGTAPPRSWVLWIPDTNELYAASALVTNGNVANGLGIPWATPLMVTSIVTALVVTDTNGITGTIATQIVVSLNTTNTPRTLVTNLVNSATHTASNISFSIGAAGTNNVNQFSNTVAGWSNTLAGMIGGTGVSVAQGTNIVLVTNGSIVTVHSTASGTASGGTNFSGIVVTNWINSTNLDARLAAAGGTGKLDATNGYAVSLALSNATLWGSAGAVSFSGNGTLGFAATGMTVFAFGDKTPSYVRSTNGQIGTFDFGLGLAAPNSFLRLRDMTNGVDGSGVTNIPASAIAGTLAGNWSATNIVGTIKAANLPDVIDIDRASVNSLIVKP